MGSRTNNWSFLVRECDGFCLLDNSLSEFFSIVEKLNDNNEIFQISAISDSLLVLCISRSIEIPQFIIGIYHRNWLGNDEVVKLEIPTSIQIIDACFGFHQLQEIVFPLNGSLRELRGFERCRSLPLIEIPASVEIIQGFDDCDSLTEIKFPKNCLIVNGFSRCPLSQIEIPSSVKSLQGFNGCVNLKRISFFKGNCLQEIRGFSQCRLLTKVEIPTSVTSIQGFDECINLAEIIFAKTSCLETIRGFSECLALPRIEIPDSVTKIRGFDECVNLTEIIFSKTSRLKIILGFSECLTLSRIEMPVPVEIVYGFNECPAFQEMRFVENSQIHRIFGLNRSPNVIIKMPWNIRIDRIQMRVFIEYSENNEVKQRRRKFQLGSSGYFEKREFPVFRLGVDSSESEGEY
jgi:hypothetical protein